MSTFKFHSSVNETVPWQAQYTFPTQATKVNKHVVKLPPKNGGTFVGGQTVRIEFPSDNYLNTLNSVLQFDLTTTFSAVNNAAIGTLPSTAVVGSFVLPIATNDGQPTNYYNGWQLTLTDADANNTIYTVVSYNTTGHQLTLDKPLDYNYAIGSNYQLLAPVQIQQGGAHNCIKRLRILYGSLVIEDIQEYKTLTRLLFEMGVDQGYFGSSGSILDGTAGGRFTDTEIYGNAGFNSYADMSNIGVTGQVLSGSTITRTYVLNLMSGLLTCKKLLPLKWMAAQLSIEITLASDKEVYLCAAAAAPTMSITNTNFIAEMVEFDSTYDSAFFQGLTSGGVPLKFSSWHFHSFSLTGTKNILQVHERARSVKMALGVIKSSLAAQYTNDTERFFHDAGADFNNNGAVNSISNPGAGNVISYWWRIGGRYYPSQPVRAYAGGGEAFAELQKCIDTLGDYTRNCNIDILNWQSKCSIGDTSGGVMAGRGDKFIIAGAFENTDVMPDQIAGINAEEQSDLALEIDLNGNPAVGKVCNVFVAYDSMIIVRDGNVVDLVL